MVRWRTLAVAVGLCPLLLAGCGSQPQSAALKPHNLTKVEVTKPAAEFDPAPIPDKSAVTNQKIYDAKGNRVTLKDGTPFLIEAYWCPHCQRTLVLLNQNKDKLKQRPIIVSSGFPQNTTIQQAVAVTKQEFQMLGISGFDVLYSLDTFSRNVLPIYPTLVFTANGQLQRLSGEHELGAWQKALDGGK